MVRRFLIFAVLIALSQFIVAQSEDSKARPNKEEITAQMLQINRLPKEQQGSRLEQIMQGQASSKTPRSDFMFCTGLAHLGNCRAQICVGKAYENELGIVEDLSEAYTWYAVAADNKLTGEADANKAEANRERIMLRLMSAYPHPTEDELADLVALQKSRIAQYQEQIKKAER